MYLGHSYWYLSLIFDCRTFGNNESLNLWPFKILLRLSASLPVLCLQGLFKFAGDLFAMADISSLQWDLGQDLLLVSFSFSTILFCCSLCVLCCGKTQDLGLNPNFLTLNNTLKCLGNHLISSFL